MQIIIDSLSSEKKKDNESSLGYLGVRKLRLVEMQAYDNFISRFFQLDSQLLSGEKYYGCTQYNNSLLWRGEADVGDKTV
jgi:hypothetical protein